MLLLKKMKRLFFSPLGYIFFYSLTLVLATLVVLLLARLLLLLLLFLVGTNECQLLFDAGQGLRLLLLFRLLLLVTLLCSLLNCDAFPNLIHTFVNLGACADWSLIDATSRIVPITPFAGREPAEDCVHSSIDFFLLLKLFVIHCTEHILQLPDEWHARIGEEPLNVTYRRRKQSVVDTLRCFVINAQHEVLHAVDVRIECFCSGETAFLQVVIIRVGLRHETIDVLDKLLRQSHQLEIAMHRVLTVDQRILSERQRTSVGHVGRIGRLVVASIKARYYTLLELFQHRQNTKCQRLT